MRIINKYQNGKKIIRYRALSGDVYNTREEAVADNKRYYNDPEYRFRIKSRGVEHSKSYSIPFIESKRIKLSNAGYATGAVLSENLLDTIAKYANQAGLPIKTALGLAVKESTLGNPTTDQSLNKILSPINKLVNFPTTQYINNGHGVNPEFLVNYYKDYHDPYFEALEYLLKYKESNPEYYKQRLEGGERYADNKVPEYEEKYGKNHILYNAFRDYKNNPSGYNPNQSNYQELVNRRAEEVWQSPEIQEWYKSTRNYKSGGTLNSKFKDLNKYQNGKDIASPDALNVYRDEKDIKKSAENFKNQFATSNGKVLNFVLPEVVVQAPYTGKNKEVEALLDNPNALSSFTDRQKEFAGNINQAMNNAAATIAPAFIGLVNPLSFSAGMAGGTFIDEAAKQSGYQDWGDLASNGSTNPVTRTLWGFTNPGYLLGGLGAKQMGSYGRYVTPQNVNLLQDLNNAKIYLQNKYPAVFDPYTSWDATLGYHGNNFLDRVVGTIARRHNIGYKPEIPEFHRRLKIYDPSGFRFTNDGKFIVSSGRVKDGHDGIVNFATSEPARGHQNHMWLSGVPDFIINPKVLEGTSWKSIHPSDTFLKMPSSESVLSVDPKYVTLVSGEPEVLKFARSKGMKTLSSPKLRQLSQDDPSILFSKGAHKDNAYKIGKEIQRLTSMRGAPTIEDYAYFEDATGLRSGALPVDYLNRMRQMYPRNFSHLRGAPQFNNVVYNPATSVESLYRKATIGDRPWIDFYKYLRNTFSSRVFVNNEGVQPILGLKDLAKYGLHRIFKQSPEAELYKAIEEVPINDRVKLVLNPISHFWKRENIKSKRLYFGENPDHEIFVEPNEDNLIMEK